MSSNEFSIPNPRAGESADAGLHEELLNNQGASLFASWAAVGKAVQIGIPRDVAITLMIPEPALRVAERSEEL